MEVLVPDLGEFADVEIIEILKSVGDTVQSEDPLIVLETDKATLEVPSTDAGVISEWRVAVGDRVSSGDTILLLDAESRVASDTTANETANETASEQESSPSTAESAPDKLQEAARREPSAASQPTPITSSTRLHAIDEPGFAKAHASPSVRKLARELGVDLSRVTGTGHKDRVTAENLKAFVKQVLQAAGGSALPMVQEVDFGAFGPVEVQPLTRIQKIAGPRLHASWVNVPHVTHHDEADITDLEAARQSLKAAAAEQGLRLTALAFVIRACILALEAHPRFASSLSSDGKSLILKSYRHIGFAADTPNGLVVPVIRDADRMNLYEVAGALADLSERARAGKLGGDDLQGGVFTISSLGGIGGTAFTPIINAPEVAILGVSRSQERPVYHEGELVPRLILPLSLSYDHRVIDGAEAARFTRYLAEALGQADRLVEGSDGG